MPSNAPTIGCDPEFFLVDKEDNTIPAVGIVPGTKEEPYDLGDGYACHEDCVTVEITVPPTRDSATLANHVSTARSRVYEEFLKDRELGFLISAAQKFDKKALSTKQAKTFGCQPDYDAYAAGKVRGEVPKSIVSSPYRFAGHHIHMGGKFNCPPFVVALMADVMVYIPAVLRWNARAAAPNNKIRSEWYGKPGIFREKPYGIEYRSLPPIFFSTTPQAEYMYSNAAECIDFLTTHTADQLRTIVQKLPWRDIQEFLTIGLFDKKVDTKTVAKELQKENNRIIHDESV